MDRFILMSLFIPALKTFTADARYMDGKKMQLQGIPARKG